MAFEGQRSRGEPGYQTIVLRDTYSVYDNFFQLAKKLGGVNGYAHWGLGAAENGLAVDGPQKLLSFIEVLQFEYPHYEVWYQLLNLGIPLAPTAGTDFPCGPWSVPGRERFYTRVDGELTRQSWLEGIRKGSTFVTNGPLLQLPDCIWRKRYGNPAGARSLMHLTASKNRFDTHSDQ